MVTDSPETRRARALLMSSRETLERSRNRPHVESDWREPEAPAQPIVRKVRTEARTMDGGTQARWDAWAEAIAKRVSREHGLKLVSGISKGIAEQVALALKERDERIDALERKLEQVKQQRWDQPRREDA